MKVRTEKKYILSNGNKIKLLVIRPADSRWTEKVLDLLFPFLKVSREAMERFERHFEYTASHYFAEQEKK